MIARPPAAVLGAGIMGSCTALHLARLGVPVTLFDRERAPFCGASRWNEGKIHLGFLYAADPTLDTARAVLPGGLDFRDQVERLTGVSLETRTTPGDDLYLVHRDSVRGPEEVSAYFKRLAALVREHPGAGRYLTDVSGCRIEAVARRELEEVADPAVVVAGYRAPERSVDTNFVADAFLQALEAETGLEFAFGQTVTGVSDAGDGRWFVRTPTECRGPFGAVVNALAEERPRLDRSIGHRPDTAHQHRYRVSLFARTETRLDSPSAVVAVGPFGDIKNYDGRTFYLSWYEAGLLARAETVDPPPVPDLEERDRRRIVSAAFARLGAILPPVREVERAASEIRIDGGWVYSQGRGRLDDPAASVHRRDRHGISRRGSYFSVDTGKYSVAPTRAEELARMVAAPTA